jgi:hypothetical protein
MLAARIRSSVKKDFTPRTRTIIQRCSIGSCHEDDRVQRKAIDGDRSLSSAPPIVLETLQSPGRPLDHATRAFFEPRFGQDFSAVRVHTDDQASESARAVNAMAYTVGHNIAFRTGRYAPEAAVGKRLLAHELTHVVQQRQSAYTPDASLRVGPPASPAESESSAIADTLSHSGAGTVHPNVAAPVQVMRELPAQDTPSAASAPDAGQLSPEQVLQQCDHRGVKIFPYRGTRFGAAPIEARREGDYIVVYQPIYVRDNSDFKAQTSTLPIETFFGGVYLQPDEVVRVHTYTPPWYNLNILGSVWGDKEEEHCVPAEQMLQFSEDSTWDTWKGIGLSVIDVASFYLPVGEWALALLQPLLNGVRPWLAAAMLGLVDAAPTAIGGIASDAVTIVVEEQVTREVAGITLTETVEQTVVQVTEQGVVTEVPSLAGESAISLGSGLASDIGDVTARGATAVAADVASDAVLPQPPLAGVLEPSGLYVGRVQVPSAPSPQVLGQLIEQPIRQLIAQYYGFSLPAKNPNATGPDVIVPAAEVARVGFEIGDIKPFNEAGQKKFWEQLDNWRDHGWVGGPVSKTWLGRAALFFYDQQTGDVWLYGVYEVTPTDITAL